MTELSEESSPTSPLLLLLSWLCSGSLVLMLKVKVEP